MAKMVVSVVEIFPEDLTLLEKAFDSYVKENGYVAVKEDIEQFIGFKKRILSMDVDTDIETLVIAKKPLEENNTTSPDIEYIETASPEAVND